MYCKKCGGKLESYASNCAFCGAPVEKYDTKVNFVKEKSSEEVKYMSVAKWIGLMILPAVPLVGTLIWLVLMFKWARRSNSDLTLRGYARANLLVLVVVILMFVGLVAFVMLNPAFLENMEAMLEAQGK